MVGTLYTARNQEYTAMQLAIDGPCKGHECDSCWKCRNGYCCKRDNPDYVLPKEGDWDGPIFGELGVLRIVGDTVECHACGGHYRSIGQHAAFIHKLDAREYKAVFGLNATTSLQAPHVIEANRQRTLNMIAAGKISTIDKHPEYVPTPEQMSAMKRGKRFRRQGVNTRQSEQFRTKMREVTKRPRGGSIEVTCVACGKTFACFKSRIRRTCGSAECKREMRSQSNKGRRKSRKQSSVPIPG